MGILKKIVAGIILSPFILLFSPLALVAGLVVAINYIVLWSFKQFGIDA